MFTEDDDDSGTVFRDMLFIVLFGFIACVVLLLPYINPPAKAAAKSVEPPGNIVFEATWPAEIDADVDLWIGAPGGERVGYSAKSSPLMNLLRDDLGHANDRSGMNYEVAYTRGIVPGEFVVNVHFYRSNDSVLPVPVRVVASVKRSAAVSAEQIVVADLSLRAVGGETTAFRFRLNADGRLVPGSVNKVFRSVRAAG